MHFQLSSVQRLASFLPCKFGLEWSDNGVVIIMGRFTWGPKFQHGCKVPVSKPQETIKIW